MKHIVKALLCLTICLLALSGCNAQKPNAANSGNVGDTDEAIPDSSTDTSANEESDEPSKEIPDSSIVEENFTLESDGFKLNAVYTYINDGKPHPAVLLIAGSGPSDYNESVGVLKPFEDIAQGLAQNNINSLRVDKRTFAYASEFDVKSGIAEEYLDDCNAAIEYLSRRTSQVCICLDTALAD